MFVLDLATRRITQLTHDVRAGWTRLTWSPQGHAIVYLRFAAVPMAWDELLPAIVRRVLVDGGEPETLSARARLFRAVFYLPDGGLAWTVVEPGMPRRTRIEVRSPNGMVSPLRTLEGYLDRVVVSPRGHGLYGRYRQPVESGRSEAQSLVFVPLDSGATRRIVPLSDRMYWEPQFAVNVDETSLFLGGQGQLWRIRLPGGQRDPMSFRARVRVAVRNPTPPRRWDPAPPGTTGPPRGVLWPTLSPDGRTLVFGAAHQLWRQSLGVDGDIGGGQPQRLLIGGGLEWAPAFSPDGRQLALVRRRVLTDQVDVVDLDRRRTRTVAIARRLSDPSWSPDGTRLVFVEQVESGRSRIVVVDLSNGRREVLAASPRSGARPHFSADGESIYFSSGPDRGGAVFRTRVGRRAQPEPVVRVPGGLMDGRVSPDDRWVVFQRNQEVWVAPLGPDVVAEERLRRLSLVGGRTFTLTPDGSAALYAAGHRVWRHPLAGGEPKEIPLPLRFRREAPPQLLLRRVRVLDFAQGGFGAETSLFLEQGQIRWIGAERDRVVPPETVIVDTSGRYAIPGLFEMHGHGSPHTLHSGPAYLASRHTNFRSSSRSEVNSTFTIWRLPRPTGVRASPRR